MLINKNTTIFGTDVILISYQERHVEKYNEWMQSKELQRLTGSEPLTLAQEYEMQQTWMKDENKCTFIVLDKGIYQKNYDDIEGMIGDTNLFFTEGDGGVAEAEIMIAEPEARGKRRGWEAMILMLLYGINYLAVQRYVVKIVDDNLISIRMFEKLGFKETERSVVFKEITMARCVDNEWTNWLNKNIGHYEVLQNNTC